MKAPFQYFAGTLFGNFCNLTCREQGLENQRESEMDTGFSQGHIVAVRGVWEWKENENYYLSGTISGE